MSVGRARYLWEGGEEATTGRRGDFGGVDGGDHEGITDADAGDEAREHKKGIVRGYSHQDGSGEEDASGKDDRVTPADPVGGSAGEA